MPIEVIEKATSRGLNLATGGGADDSEFEYWVTGSEDQSAVASAVIAAIPFVVRLSLIPKTLKLEKLESYGHWSASIKYASPDKVDKPKQIPRAIGQATWSFDATGGTQKVFEALAQTASGANAPAAGKQINIDAGKVQGVDIVVPQLTLTINQKFAGSTLTLPWVRAFAQLIGTTNDDTFLGFEAGELLLLGGNGTQPVAYNDDGTTTFGERDVSFQFAYSPNRDDLAFSGDRISVTGVTKKGHDYIWYAYETAENTDSLAADLIGVYVATVYEESDYTTLGIVNPDDFPGGV
jgi:hypothetical protein